MAVYEAVLPTTLGLFHDRFSDLLMEMQGYWTGSPLAFSSLPPSRAKAFYQMKSDEFEMTHYRVEHDRRPGFTVVITAVHYLPQEITVTVHYDKDSREELLFVARLVVWLEKRFKAQAQTRRPELTEAQEWYLHCTEREEAYREHGTSYTEFDKARGKGERTARKWCKEFRESWGL